MPATLVKKLYVAKSMKDLENDCCIEKSIQMRNTNSLVNTAHKVFHAAEMSNLEKDEEKAYVQYSRFVELVLMLKKKPDFQKHPENKKLSLNANAAIGKAEHLKESLSKRYSILEEANCLAENEKNNLLTALQNNKADVILPNNCEPPKNIEPPKAEEISEYSISSYNLLQLMNAANSYLIIMDTRSAKDFDESHIKHPKCINIPEDTLTPGTTAAKLESKLPAASLGDWYNRGLADHIIILDFDSRDEKSQSSRIDVLKQAMSKWDQTCTLKKPPMVLQGGYKDWMRKYPMFTTQAINYDSLVEPVASLIIGDVLEIEYPNLDEPEKTTPTSKENLNEPGILFKKSNVPVPTPQSTNTSSRGTKSAPSINRKSKPTVDRSTKSSLGNHKNLNNASPVPNNKDKSQPSIINNLAQKPPPERDPKLVSSLNEESSLASENLELARQQLAKEQEFEKLRMRKELEAEEGMRMEIQKREELLLEGLRRVESDLREKERALTKVKEDNVILKRQLEEKSDKEFQRLKEKEILEIERKKKEMQESVEKLREQRKQQELLARKQKELSKTDVIPRNAVSANTGLKRNMSQQDQNNSKPSEYTIPLSRQGSNDGSSRGLVRSHSSPNIAQMVNEEESPLRKIPTVDRSLKPKANTPIYQQNEISISRARLRNLNPVYGNCPVRPATGLRNLGNTCFMNSVIQCLSNTLPLAEYFTSSNYEEDINRENKHGTGGEVAEEFAVVIRALWMGQYKSFSPKDFKNTVSKCLAVCIGNEQQDSHEFLVVLMEKLHADLNKKSLRPIPKLESSDENKFWLHHKNYNSSKVSDMFEGLLKSTLTCMSCRTTSDSFEVFSCLSLPILASKCSLEDCFRHFLKSEKISGEAAWDCPKCKQKKEADKRLRLCRVPEILVIQLKRFSYEGLWRRKLQTTVNFDFHFDVPYEKNSDVYHRKYSLYGIVNHFGTLEGGHYTAYCSTSSRKWYKYDDHEVSEISSSDIRTPAAYLLFYRATDMHSSL